MSFSDFKGPSRSTTTATTTTKKPTPSSSGKDSLSLISESLLQYQRNVGILDKIVQSLTARSTSRSSQQELELQFKAQVDVIGQLEQKLVRQLQEAKGTASNSTTLIKLTRDLERVQHRALQLQEQVTRLHKQQAQVAAAAVQDPNSVDDQRASAQEDYYQKMQLQLEEDRLNEEIMREREEEIRNINRGMHQVNEIYKDLAHIVGSQQEQIDSIETQMEDSRANAESGLQQVEKANDRFGSSQCTIS